MNDNKISIANYTHDTKYRPIRSIRSIKVEDLPQRQRSVRTTNLMLLISQMKIYVCFYQYNIATR